MVHLRHRNLLQTMAATIFPPFYRRRAARKRYFCHFIVTARRGNNIFAFLSSPRSAGTIFLPFYRHRAAREQYFRVLSSPCSAGTIFLPFYRHRAARERYFCRFSACCAPANTFPNGFDVCSPTASVQKCGENRAGMAAGLMQRGK